MGESAVVIANAGPLSKTAALAALRKPPQGYSWRVEATTADGQRWINGVRLKTSEESEVYIEAFARFELEEHGYVTAEMLRCDGEPATNSISRNRKGGRPILNFLHGTCGCLN